MWRLIGRVLLVLVVVVNLLFVLLYVQDARLPGRYVGLFKPEDGTYAAFYPREPVDGGDRAIPVAAGDERTIADDALAAMRDFAAREASYSLVVIHEGRIQTEWYAEGWSAGRQAQSQSMHKSLLPILIGAAIRDGVIDSVDDRAGKYLPEWSDDPRGDITLAQLMAMASGLEEYPFSLNPFSDAFQWLFASDTRPILLRTPLVTAPGTEFVYNNVNSEILGLIIEAATGQRYSTYLEETLWRPIGAGRAELWLEDDDGKAHTSCCLLSSAHDWARFGLLLLGRGEIDGQRVVSDDFFARMISQSALNDWYGFQIWLGYSEKTNPRAAIRRIYQRSEPFLASDTYFASGYGGQRVYVAPSKALVIVRMGPSTGFDPVTEAWDNAFLVNTAIRGMTEG